MSEERKVKIRNKTITITLTDSNIDYINKIMSTGKYNYTHYEKVINEVIKYSHEKTYFL